MTAAEGPRCRCGHAPAEHYDAGGQIGPCLQPVTVVCPCAAYDPPAEALVAALDDLSDDWRLTARTIRAQPPSTLGDAVAVTWEQAADELSALVTRLHREARS